MTFFRIISFAFLSMGILANAANETIKPVYYTKENLSALNAAGKKKHAPCLILVDQYHPETFPGAMYLAFTAGLSLQYTPMLVSAGVLLNYCNHNAWHSALTQSNWRLFDIPNTQFFLIVPAFYATHYQDMGFNYNVMKDISNLLPDQGSYMGFLTSYVKNKAFFEFSPDNIRKIFTSKKEKNGSVKWDLFFIGHGGYLSQLAGMKPVHMQKTLHTLNTHISVGSVYLLTCFLGGSNLNMLEYYDKGVPETHNYTIVAGSITDAPVYAHSTITQTQISAFFNNAAYFTNKGKAFSNFVKNLAFPIYADKDVHGTSGIIQIWLPELSGFKTFNINPEIMVVGSVASRVAHMNEQELVATGKRAVLVYPTVTLAPIRVSPIVIPSMVKSSVAGQLPVAQELKSYENQSYLYPDFIALKRGNNTIQTINKIVVEAPYKHMGILHFLRDAFCDLKMRATQKTFLINHLEGNNDIAITLDMLYPNKFQSVLHKELVGVKGQMIQLYNVTVTTKGSIHSSPTIWIRFIYNGKAWSVKNESYNRWNFTEINLSLYQQEYEANKRE